MTLEEKRPPVLASRYSSRDGSLAIETQSMSINLRPVPRNSISGFLDALGCRVMPNVMEGFPPFDKNSCQET